MRFMPLCDCDKSLLATTAIHSYLQYSSAEGQLQMHQDMVIGPGSMFCTCVQTYACMHMHVCLRTCMCEFFVGYILRMKSVSGTEVLAFVTT